MSANTFPRFQRAGGGAKHTLSRKQLSLEILRYAPGVTRGQRDKLASAAVARQCAGLDEDPLQWALHELHHRDSRVFLNGFDPTWSTALAANPDWGRVE